MGKNKICSCGAVTWTGKCKACSNRSRKGNFTWSEEAKKKIRGSGNHQWKEKFSEDKHGGSALHRWIRFMKPKTKCESCGEESHDVANISGEYKRDILDFMWLCRKCHMKSDGRLEKLISRNSGRRGSHGAGWAPLPVDPYGRRTPSDNTSGFRGVSWDNHNKKWKAAIKIKGEYNFLGRFDDIRDAADAYDKFSKTFLR